MALERETENQVLAALQTAVQTKTVRVGIIGMGYVGLPVALLFAKNGIRTTGFDIDPVKIDTLRAGHSYIKHIPDPEIALATQQSRFEPTTNFSKLTDTDVIIICVPTPLDEHREPDLSYIRDTAETISAFLRRGQLVVLESTTYPGTTEEVVLPILEQSGLVCPAAAYDPRNAIAQAAEAVRADFLLAFSPEREDPGNKSIKTEQIPKVIGGVNAASALAAQAVYQLCFEQTLLVSSSQTAEMTKLLENIYRCVNIALVNELKLLCLKMGLDIWEVIEAAKTKPFGFSAFYPGPGLGGHCIPIDPFYLSWKAREYKLPTRFIELAGEINTAMPQHVVGAIRDALNRRHQSLCGSRILVLGIAYKKDVDDLRESPSLKIIELLQAQGAEVDYQDPYFPRLHKMRRYDFQLESVPLTDERLAGYDAVVIATDHSCYDYDFIAQHAHLVIDTRNATRNVTQHRQKIVRC